MFNLDKFNNNYVLGIHGTDKDTYLESWEHGEGNYNGTFNCDYLNKKFILSPKEITEENVSNLLINHLKNNLYSNDIQKDWLTICHDRLILQTYEIDDYYSSEIITNIKKQEDLGKQVYSCYYNLYLTLNGKRLQEEDLKELLPCFDQ